MSKLYHSIKVSFRSIFTPIKKRCSSILIDNRFTIILACRQSGKSISSVAYLLWYAIFHPEKTIAVLANKGSTSREMLGRVTLMLENLPFFLQPGCKTLNKGSIEFSNNSRIVAASTSGSSIRGMSVNLLYLDEFAFVERAGEFYTSTYPVISSGKDTKVIITSTANGIGIIFHKIWEGAEQGTNEFKSFRVDWWDVPSRDEAWKQRQLPTLRNCNSIKNLVILFSEQGHPNKCRDAFVVKIKSAPAGTRGWSMLVYDETRPSHEYIMTVDVSKGRGQDYSTFTVIDITTSPLNRLLCIGTTLSLQYSSLILYISTRLFTIMHMW